MVYGIFSKLKIEDIAKKNNLQRRYQWSGPNYAKGIVVIAVSAVVGAMGASMFAKYWQINYGMEQVARHSDDKNKKK